MSFYSYPNRTVCEMLNEMRKMHETRNYAGLLSLIEEVQLAVNRMEAGLGDKRDCSEWAALRSKLKREILKLRATRDKLMPDEE